MVRVGLVVWFEAAPWDGRSRTWRARRLYRSDAALTREIAGQPARTYL